MCIVMQRASCGEQTAATQEKLQQLRFAGGHMDVQDEAAQAAPVLAANLLHLTCMLCHCT